MDFYSFMNTLSIVVAVIIGHTINTLEISNYKKFLLACLVISLFTCGYILGLCYE